MQDIDIESNISIFLIYRLKAKLMSWNKDCLLFLITETACFLCWWWCFNDITSTGLCCRLSVQVS